MSRKEKFLFFSLGHRFNVNGRHSSFLYWNIIVMVSTDECVVDCVQFITHLLVCFFSPRQIEESHSFFFRGQWMFTSERVLNFRKSSSTTNDSPWFSITSLHDSTLCFEIMQNDASLFLLLFSSQCIKLAEVCHDNRIKWLFSSYCGNKNEQTWESGLNVFRIWCWRGSEEK